MNEKNKYKIDENTVREKLQEVMDPEIPKLSVVDLGVITGIQIDDENNVSITMTPTFAGCPAVEYMKNDIVEKLSALKAGVVKVDVNYDVQWNSNMITDRGREMLKESGFALPGKHNGLVQIELLQNVECPFCGSKQTDLRSTFGPTQCRAIHYCNNCLQSFEQFKPV
ncbi:MAG: phenylacetate-CoA oxygenase subunit PaaJ [Ignavibacteria bacterium]|nr:phenylacetate-CoA oxygenase subunit PaaJ [Ignavibacteria bacterium]